jgi:hypothetical protein
MSVIEGTTKLKAWKGIVRLRGRWRRGRHDHAAIGRWSDAVGSVVEGGYFEVNTGFTTGASGTGALQVEGAGDLLAGTVVSGAPWSTTGRKSVIPAFTGATTLKTTASRKPAFVIATGAITAGKFDLVLYYR